MSWKIRQSVIAGLALLAAPAVLAVEAPVAPAAAATPVTKARAAARANAATPQGREVAKRLSAAAGPLIIPVLNRCLPEDADELTAFSIFVRLSQKGRVREVVTDLGAGLGTCMTAGARELQLPEAPRDDYWIQVNLAADL